MSAVGKTSTQVLLTGSGLAAFLTVGHTATDALVSMLAALLPIFQERFELTPPVLALLVATLFVSSSIMQPLFGGLADRLGPRLVGGLGVILSAALLSLLGVVPTVWLLFGLLLIGGLGSAAYHPAGVSMARAAGGPHAGLAVSLFSAGGTLGFALGPVLSLWFVSSFGLSFTPWLMIPGIILGVLIAVVVPPQERPPVQNRPKLFDAQLFAGPVGLLSLTEICSSVAFVTFSSAMPLWLVAAHGVARDAALIGWTLAAFSLAAALGGIAASALSTRASRRLLVAGSMALAPGPLLATLHLDPGTPVFFLAVMLAGALVNAGQPLKVVSAQDLAPRAVATASGMLMGFAMGIAAVLYVGVGWLQESIGLIPAMSFGYLLLLPGALLAFAVLPERRALDAATGQAALAVSLAGASCRCAAGSSTALPLDPRGRLGERRESICAEARVTCESLCVPKDERKGDWRASS